MHKRTGQAKLRLNETASQITIIVLDTSWMAVYLFFQLKDKHYFTLMISIQKMFHMNRVRDTEKKHVHHFPYQFTIFPYLFKSHGDEIYTLLQKKNR